MKYWVLIAEDKAASSEVARSLEGWKSSVSAIAGPEAEVGDTVLLWRSGRGSGVVAMGKIASKTGTPTSRLLGFARTQEDEDGSAPARMRFLVDLQNLMLANPISADRLRAVGLGQIVKRARSAGGNRKLVMLGLTGDQWQMLVQLADQADPPTNWPAMWNIPPGSVVKRSELHEVYGGNPRLVVGSSAKTPNALLFLDTSRTRELAPRWSGSVLLAPGQGQYGDSVSLENLAVLAHLRRGIPVRVFMMRGVECLYVGEFAIDPEQPIERWVVTGKRECHVLDHELCWDVQTPIFRLCLLNGTRADMDHTDAFQGAPRISLSLHPASDQPVATTIRGLLTMLESNPAIAASLNGLGEAQLLAALVQRARRQADLAALRAAVEDPKSSEGDLQKLIQRMTWIFGGHFLPGTARRNLTLRDQLDLTLLRPDGTLHGVELKKANIDRLVIGQRNHLVVGNEVNKAVGQAMNYLRELDEKRPQLLVDLGIDSRRASMTVVIGHSAFVANGATPAEIDEAVRTYNSHLTRVSVTTYDWLINNAQRALDLTTAGS
ncbi:Shedu anti-phage system protein SduA domain-containing protein [Streptomyces sp. RPT161]|uniref:Shedu anti-phage system protein SduA domain-containing protein n=1 Tax=Streptomyces sp. RPT161 TaxID=3015993 RepID=UPI0022B8A77D|nr:Shedu anti-phage system protein SduA domain-containing protein [Streptomyces sp. RPT161]